MNNILDIIFPSRVWIREQERTLFNSLDGVHYTKKQYQAAYDLVVSYLGQNGYTDIRVGDWIVTGAIAGYAINSSGKEVCLEYYMRDLVLGSVREDGASDYRIAVNRATVSGENGL